MRSSLTQKLVSVSIYCLSLFSTFIKFLPLVSYSLRSLEHYVSVFLPPHQQFLLDFFFGLPYLWPRHFGLPHGSIFGSLLYLHWLFWWHLPELGLKYHAYAKFIPVTQIFPQKSDLISPLLMITYLTHSFPYVENLECIVDVFLFHTLHLI
jgi:hypothetical protein